MSGFTYVREPGRCELCGADVDEDALRTVELEELRTVTARGEPAARLGRVIRVCAAHELDTTPRTLLRTTRLPGTSRRSPQTERLFMPGETT